MKRLNIEAEGRELILQSDEGHYAIIPVKDRQKVMDMIGCDNCINNYIKSLPKASHYASDGSVIPANKKVQVRQSDNSIREYDINSKEYEDLYNSGHLATYDEATDTYAVTPLPEVTIKSDLSYRDWEKDRDKLGVGNKVNFWETYNWKNWGLTDYTDYSNFNSAFRNAKENNDSERK